MNNRFAKRNNNFFVQRNNKRAKGTTVVPFKGTIGVQKKQQLFHSKEQKARKRNNRRTKRTTIFLFKGIVGMQEE
jgi:hypothetical protein